jgi:hypothetical protein
MIYFEEYEDYEVVMEKNAKLLAIFVANLRKCSSLAPSFCNLAFNYDDSDDVTRGVINYVFMSLCGWSLPDLCRIAENIKGCDDIAGIESANNIKRADVPVIHPDVVVARVNPHSLRVSPSELKYPNAQP